MNKVILNNSKALRNFLDSKNYIYEIVADGWSILLNFYKKEDIFTLGIEFGQYLVNNPN